MPETELDLVAAELGPGGDLAPEADQEGYRRRMARRKNQTHDSVEPLYTADDADRYVLEQVEAARLVGCDLATVPTSVAP